MSEQHMLEAAERLRKTQLFGGNADHWSIYLYGSEQYREDEKEVIRQYLREHRSDDEVGITRDWWDIVADDGTDLKLLHFGDDKSFWLDWLSDGLTMESPTGCVCLKHITTRGQLRLLARALNITLREEE